MAVDTHLGRVTLIDWAACVREERTRDRQTGQETRRDGTRQTNQNKKQPNSTVQDGPGRYLE